MNGLHLPMPNIPRIFDVIPEHVPERIQLAPLQLSSFDHGTPSSSGMERQYSVSSTSSSGQSSYCPSPSGSGASTPITSPRLGRIQTHAPHRSHPYHSASGPSIQSVRCMSCLERGEHVVMESGKPCESCGTEQSRTGKAPRKKRNDRRQFSRLFSSNAKPNNVSKDQSEAGNRFDLTGTFGLMEKHLLRTSPTLHTDAALGDGRTKLGWKPLNTNNVSKDVEEPLTHNKIEIHISSIQVMRHSDAILENCNEECIRLQTKARNMLRSNASEAEMRNFLEHFADFDWSERVKASCSKRGCSSFQLPFPPHSAL